MAGLDTRGAFDGFVQGFGLMQGYQNNKDNKAIRQEQLGMQQRGLEMREQEFEGQQQDRQKKNDQEYITQFYERTMPLMQDADNPESIKMLAAMFEDEEASTVLSRNKLADMRHLFNPKTIAAAQYAGELGKGEGQLFSDKTAAAMNDYFSPTVNRMPGRRTRINGVYPGQKEGTMAFDLGITPLGDDGVEGEEYFGPMTNKRGVEGEDDDVMQVSIEQMIQKVKGSQAIYEALGPEKIAQIQKSLRNMGYLAPEEAKWEEVKGPGGSIQQRNTVTGEMKNVLGRAPVAARSGGGTSGSKSTSKQSDYEFHISRGKSPEEAERLAFGGDSTGDSLTSDDRYWIEHLTKKVKEVDTVLATFPPKDETAKLLRSREKLIRDRDVFEDKLGLKGSPAQGLQKPNPITGRVYSDANGNKARWNGSEYVPVDAGQSQLGTSDVDQELRKLWSTTPADTNQQ
ncbi:MAG TPA: hypothetical protein VJY57_10130 [Thiopseudomonas sp.]|nr:hypothetical protein [Thiopseudomonas sp.]